MALLAVPCSITERLLQVVAALQRLSVPTTVDGIASTARVSTVTTRKLVTALYGAGWLERERLYHLRRKGNAPYGYRLTRAGRETADERFGIVTAHRAGDAAGPPAAAVPVAPGDGPAS